MCNNYANHVALDDYREAFEQLDVPVRFPGLMPNLEPRDEIKPTDTAPIIRMTDGGVEFSRLAWGFPAARPKAPPVINFRSEGRAFQKGRCLVPASWFYEYTGRRYPKTKWRFKKVGEPWFCIAGLWRATGEGGAAFTMLTAAPGPDVAPYHDRQVAVLDRTQWVTWLDPTVSVDHLLRPSPAGTLAVEMASQGKDAELFLQP